MKTISIIIQHFIYTVLILISTLTLAQNNNIIDRLQALENNGKVWYNIDGCSITSEKFDYNFDKKGIKKVLRKYAIKDIPKIKNEHIKANHFYFSKNEQVSKELTQKNTYYIAENQDKKNHYNLLCKNWRT